MHVTHSRGVEWGYYQYWLVELEISSLAGSVLLDFTTSGSRRKLEDGKNGLFWRFSLDEGLH